MSRPGHQALVRSASDALLHGYGTALAVGALIIAIASVVAAVLITPMRAEPTDGVRPDLQ